MTKKQFQNYIRFVRQCQHDQTGVHLRRNVWITNYTRRSMYFRTIFDSFRLNWRWNQIRYQHRFPFDISWTTVCNGWESIYKFEKITGIAFSEEMGLELLLEK